MSLFNMFVIFSLFLSVFFIFMNIDQQPRRFIIRKVDALNRLGCFMGQADEDDR